MTTSRPTTLRDVLLSRARTCAATTAYVDHDNRQLSYAELLERSSARAAALRDRGIGHGDRVALAMQTGLPIVETFWALQLIGAVPCIVNPGLPAATVQRRAQLVRPRLVITDEEASRMSGSAGRVDEVAISGEDLAYLQLTSGTTGEPRAAMIPHRAVVSFLDHLASEPHVMPGDTLVTWLPLWHDFGLVRFIIASAYDGVTSHLLAPAVSSIPDWLSRISDTRATVTGGPDMAFRLALRMVDPATVDLSSLRVAFNGGEPVRSSTIEEFENRFGIGNVVAPAYGLGEATLSVSSHRGGVPLVLDDRGNVSCGKATPTLELRAGSSVDEPEEILVRGAQVFSGYFDDPEETARVLREGWLHTGDSGYIDADGHLFVLGRRSGMIKRAGSVIAPREIEEAAQRVPGVRVAAATSLLLEGAQDEVVAVAVEASSDLPAATVRAAVLQEVRAALGFAPGRVVVLPPRSIPRTENAKIRYGPLRDLLAAELATHDSRTPL